MVAEITDEQIETVKAVFAETGKYDRAAKAAGVSWASAKKYADSRDAYESIREQKRFDIIAKLSDAQVALIDAMVARAKTGEDNVQQIATALGITTDKVLVMTGNVTDRTETLTGDPASRLTPDELEAAARIRAKLAGDGG